MDTHAKLLCVLLVAMLSASAESIAFETRQPDNFGDVKKVTSTDSNGHAIFYRPQFCRPQTAVNDFARWAKELENTKMHTVFYTAVDKNLLFSEGYIAYRSGHSRGSTVDLTIVPLGSPIPVYDKTRGQVNCTAPALQRTPDNRSEPTKSLSRNYFSADFEREAEPPWRIL